MTNQESAVASLYVVKNTDTGTYLAGYDPTVGGPKTVTNPIYAKLFTNKYDIKIRPNEVLQELKVDLSKCEVDISEPFRPARRKQ